jgi:PilZ domain
MDTQAERRRHPRYTVDLPISLVLASDPGASYAAKLHDLSKGGCFFEAVLPRSDFAGAAMSFRRQLRAPLVAGRVVRNIANRGFAVSFDRPAPELERLVSALSAITPALRGDFVAGFLDAAVEVY